MESQFPSPLWKSRSVSPPNVRRAISALDGRLGLRFSASVPLREIEKIRKHWLPVWSVMEGPGRLKVRVHVRVGGRPFKVPRNLGHLLRVGRTRTCTIEGVWNLRWCRYHYGGETISYLRKRAKVFWLRVERWEDLQDTLEAILHSVTGELLDERGRHRIHALGLSFSPIQEGTDPQDHHRDRIRGKPNDCGATLIALPQEGGKTTLAWLAVNRHPELRLISDECPVLSLENGEIRVFPFPSRLAFRPAAVHALLRKHVSLPELDSKPGRPVYPEKFIADFPLDRLAPPEVLGHLALGTLRGRGRTGGVIGVPAGSLARVFIALRLINDVILGLGVMQMVEHRLRLCDTFKIVRAAMSRVRLAISLLARAKITFFPVSRDVFQNFTQLERLLNVAEYDR